MELISYKKKCYTYRGATGSGKWFRHAGRILLVWSLLAAPLMALSYATRIAPSSVRELGDAFIAALVGDAPTSDSPSLVRGDLVTTAMAEGTRILIPSVAIDAQIVTPESADLDVMNDSLLRGAVHYPGSALPGQDGNMFLFGHSTGLAVVHNQAFRTFNRLGEVAPGDTIRIRSGSREYWYRAISRTLVHADAAIVDLRTVPGKRLLTLSTCNVFGKKDDRFVVEADFVKSYPLRSFNAATGTSS